MKSSQLWNFFLLCWILLFNEIQASKKSDEAIAKARKIAQDAYKLLGQPCDHELYNKFMPDYWDDLFSPDLNNAYQVERFQLVYWNISIEFLKGETEKKVRGLESPASVHESIFTVNRAEQEAFQNKICSVPGGLMECNKKGKCDCLNRHAVITVNHTLVQTTPGDPITGDPSDKGTLCFVKEGRKCMTKYTPVSIARVEKLEFPCEYYARCLADVGHCDAKISSAESLLKFEALIVTLIILLLGHCVKLLLVS